MIAIFTAVFRDDVHAVSKCLENGIDIESKDEEGRTPLANAAIEHSHDIIALLLRHGADINSQDGEGWTALHFAAQNCDKRGIEMLLDAGARVDVQDTVGNTPLWRAVFEFDANKDAGVIRALLAAGASRNLKNKHGVSPLDLAMDDCDRVVASLLQ